MQYSTLVYILSPSASFSSYVHDFVYYVVLIQCDDICPVESGWNSLITASAREARHIIITWTADTQSSLYVVQYRLRNTQVYTSSLEVRDPICMSLCT